MEKYNTTKKLNKFVLQLTENIRKYDTILLALYHTIEAFGVKIYKETLPKNTISMSNNKAILVNSLLPLEDSTVGYALLHGFYHTIEEAHTPLIVGSVESDETADYFAVAISDRIFKKSTPLM